MTPKLPDDDALDAALAAARAARQAGRLAEGVAQARVALARAPADSAAQTEAVHLLSLFLYRSGEHAAVIETALAWLPRLERAGTREQHFEVLRWLAASSAETGRHDQAITHSRAACQLARESGHTAWVVMALNLGAGCLARAGELWQAVPLLDEALALARPLGQVLLELATLNNQAGVAIDAYHLLRDGVDDAAATECLHRARRALEAACERLPQVADPLAHAFVHGNLGEVLTHLGLLDEGRALLDAALAEALAHGQASQVARIRCNLAENLWRRGALAAARAQLHPLTEAPAVTAALEASTQLCLHRLMARLCRDQGEPDLALAHLSQAERMLRRRTVVQLRTQAELLVSREAAELAHQARRQAQAEAEHWAEQALHDPLTGLPNRRRLGPLWPALVAPVRAGGPPLCLVVLDIDHFKAVNDRHGHRVGDAVLVAVAELLQRLSRPHDVLARIGGEEFLLLLPATEVDTACTHVEHLRRCVQGHDWAAVAPGLAVTLSAGVAPTPPLEWPALFDRADRALYRAKQAGRNRVVVADDALA